MAKKLTPAFRTVAAISICGLLLIGIHAFILTPPIPAYAFGSPLFDNVVQSTSCHGQGTKSCSSSSSSTTTSSSTTSTITTTTSGSSFFWVGGDASAIVNTGVQATIQVISYPVTGCLSYWVADDSAANMWGQVGYYLCNGSTPVAFFEIWNLNTGTSPLTVTTSVTVGSHIFSMYDSSGTVWSFALDGKVFGTYDMRASSSSPSYVTEALSEEGYVASAWNPPQVQISQIQVQLPGGFTTPQSMYSPYGCSSSSYSCWGVQGSLQDSLLPYGSIVVGGSVPPTAAGTLLW